MAEITNSAKSRLRTNALIEDIDYVAGANYSSYDPVIYDDSYGDHDETIIESRFHNDNGSVPQAVEGDLDGLKNAAKNVFRKRKPIIDWKTTNASFIEVHQDLKRLGIKNNTFFLKLYDRDLVGVDPYDPALPLDMQIKIYLECVVNPWYYIREVARVPADGSPIEPGGGDRYRLDRNNLATWYLFLNHIDNYSSKPRQCGKTQDAIHKLNYSYHFGSSSSTILFFNKDMALSKENLARMKDQRDLYPPYLQMRVAFGEDGSVLKGIDNITTMKNPVTGNEVKVMPCANSKEMATRLGRGYTAPLMMFDEFDFTNFNTEIINASVFAYSTASKNAIKNASMACRLFMSTPGDLGTRDGKAAADYIRGTKEVKGMFMWEDKYFDEPIEKLKKQIYSTNYNGIVYVEHTWKMLKKDMQWYERQCNLCGYNQEVILREVNLQRLSGNNMSPFSREQQIYLSTHKRQPISQIDIRTVDTISAINLYERLDRRIPYIISVDPADGLAGDNNAMMILNPFTKKVAGEYKCPYINAKDMARVICEFMDANCPQALIVVEANRGRDLLQRLIDSHYSHRVWYDKDKFNTLLQQRTDQYGGVPQSVITRKAMGFVTTPKSRHLLFGVLEEMIMEHIDCIYTQNLVDEMLTLIRKPPTNKIEAAPGEHDDCVLAYLIGLYVFFNASNLEEFGISRYMHAPDEKLEIQRESEEQYRHRIADNLMDIPEEYRGIFEDFLRQRDPVRDARDNARKVAAATRQQDFFMMGQARGTEFDPSRGVVERPFDQFDDPDEDPKVSPHYRSMNRQQYYNKDNLQDYGMMGGYTDADQQAFEDMVFGSNFEGREEDPFDPYGRNPDDMDLFDPDDYL